jgi:hypothetical protein
LKIQNITKNLIDKTFVDEEKAVLIHNFVRDKIRFGYTRLLDFCPPEDTVRFGYGNSISKGILMMTMLQEARINCQMHFITIQKQIYEGTLPDIIYHFLPAHLTHGFLEINIGGTYYKVDSYSIEKSLFEKLKQKLILEDKTVGYGISIMGTIDWNGHSDSLVQANAPGIFLDDHGSFQDPMVYFKEYDSYKHKFLSLQYADMVNGITNLFNLPLEIYLNSVLNHYRGQT